MEYAAKVMGILKSPATLISKLIIKNLSNQYQKNQRTKHKWLQEFLMRGIRLYSYETLSPARKAGEFIAGYYLSIKLKSPWLYLNP